jgi:hypothetical protein
VQLDKLLKDPAKPAFIAPAPKEKEIRPAREMMKNVQGSSAGAGSGEFHVYKASRRREYERLKLLDDMSQKVRTVVIILCSIMLTSVQEIDDAEFERKRRESEEVADKKTSKNRAKRQKQKERARTQKSTTKEGHSEGAEGGGGHEVPLKKRRLVNGQELVFRRPGDESDEDEGAAAAGPVISISAPQEDLPDYPPAVPVAEVSNVIIHDD